MGESYNIDQKMQAHIQREHEQGYRRVDSWRKCHVCGGSGKWCGITCPNCSGSGVE